MRMSRIPTIKLHGTSGTLLRKLGDRRLTASPRTKSSCRTAAFVLRSARKAALSSSPRNSIASRAAVTISKRVASSRSIQRLRRLQDGSSAESVGAALDRSPADEVDSPPDDTRELFLHRYMVQEAPLR